MISVDHDIKYEGVLFNIESLKNPKVATFLKNSTRDIIFTQENGDKDTVVMRNNTNYNVVFKNGMPNEQVAIYLNKNLSKYLDQNKTPINIKTVPTDEEKNNYNVVERNAICYMLNGIKIVNLHMEGGRYINKTLLMGHFDSMLAYKMKLLMEIIKLKPNIILGDFNSAYCSNTKILYGFL